MLVCECRASDWHVSSPVACVRGAYVGKQVRYRSEASNRFCSREKHVNAPLFETPKNREWPNVPSTQYLSIAFGAITSQKCRVKQIIARVQIGNPLKQQQNRPCLRPQKREMVQRSLNSVFCSRIGVITSQMGVKQCSAKVLIENGWKKMQHTCHFYTIDATEDFSLVPIIALTHSFINP